MRGVSPSEVLKVWLYAAASVLLGAWMCPLLYNMGKALAEVSSVKQTNGPLHWLAGICRGAAFPQFFETSLLLGAVLLFLPFLHWLQGGSRAAGRRFWNGFSGQRLQSNPSRMRQAGTGFLLVTALFTLQAGVLISAGVFQLKNPGDGVPMMALRGFGTALILAVFQEIIFRGVVLGIFIRAMRPSAALGLSALLFALVHLLHPPAGLNVADPDAAGVGFELLRLVVGWVLTPQAVLSAFAPLFALGVVLAYARWRTASLWLPVGIHSGWIFVNEVLGSVTVAADRPGSLGWFISGATLHQGVVPLAGILLAGVLINHFTPAPAVTDAT